MTYQPEHFLPMPLALLARACRANFVLGDDQATLRSYEDDELAGLWTMARQHRVTGLAHVGLGKLGLRLPAEIRIALAKDAQFNAAQNLSAARQVEELSNAVQGRSIDHLFLKGLALSKLAYGDPFLKTSQDIDVLVEPDQITETGMLLDELGYQCVLPSNCSLAHWHRVHKESIWVREGAVPIELHSRLADNPSLLSGVSLASPRQTVTIGKGFGIEALADEHMLAYLAVHGASSLWFRLKWLSDFAALLHHRSEEEVTGLAQAARALGTGRTFDQAIDLSQTVFASPALRLRAQPIYQRMALKQLATPHEPTSKAFGTLRIRASSLLSGNTMTFAISEAFRQLRAMLLRT